jgi:hypothetical protein
LFTMTSALLLLPNPLMPAEVRMAHLLETATSNFLFGWLVVLILRGAGTNEEREPGGRDKSPVAVAHL